MARPARKNANRDPTAVLRANTQKRRTAAQKNTDEVREATAAADAQDQVAMELREKIRAIAAMEDQLCHEDDTYRTARSMKKVVNLLVQDPDAGRDPTLNV